MEGRISLYVTVSQTALCHQFPEKRCLTTAYSHLQVHFGSSRLGSLPKKEYTLIVELLYFSLKPSKHWMLFNTVHVQKNSL